MHAYRDQYAQIFNGGRGVVLIAISADPIEELAAWARDDEFPFLVASDADIDAGEKYGAFIERGEDRFTNRSLFVIGPDGRIAHVMAPFREIDPSAYAERAAAIERVTPVADDDDSDA
jgi:thioredoxin-dependent peroxiredoxin